MIKVTEDQLNEAYAIIINQHKSGIISSEVKHASTYITEDIKLEFEFDSELGIKGHWVCITDMEVLPAEDKQVKNAD
jgi:hypothetical protein